MTSRLHPLDVVRFRKSLEEHGIAAGTRGVVLEVHEAPRLAYEVEVADSDGRTVFLGAVDPEYLEVPASEE
jgi:3-deoxy-D-arabino-heptulosonate 7-phosphate (DAHP) synthase